MQKRSRLHGYRRWFAQYKKPLIPALALSALGVLVVFSFALNAFSNGSLSPEMRFTDASESGLSIIPASGASTPQYCPDNSSAPNNDTTQCACTTGYTPNCPGGALVLCPNQTPAPYNDTNQCTCAQGNQNACSNNGGGDGGGGGVSVPLSCPTGEGGTYPDCHGGDCPVGYVPDPLLPSLCDFDACPSGYNESSDGVCVAISCPAGQSPNAIGVCTASSCVSYPECDTGGDIIDSCSGTIETPASACPYGCENGECKAPPAPVVLRALLAAPTLVKKGQTTVLVWNVENVTDCAITGTNGDSWTSLTSPINGQVSGPILAQTLYTLHCGIIAGAENPDGTPATWNDETVTVNIVPTFNEQ
jgi:hypothetical protein